MRPVNLIPPEERRGDRAARRTGMVPYLLVGLAAVAVVAVSLVTLVGKQVDDRETRLANLQARGGGDPGPGARRSPPTPSSPRCRWRGPPPSPAWPRAASTGSA